MTHTINKDILKPICKDAIKREYGVDNWDLYSDALKAQWYCRATSIILSYERQKMAINAES